MSDELTNDDIDMIQFFHKEKGDITCWMEWETKKALVERQWPALIAAMSNMAVAQQTLDAIVKSLELEEE